MHNFIESFRQMRAALLELRLPQPAYIQRKKEENKKQTIWCNEYEVKGWDVMQCNVMTFC